MGKVRHLKALLADLDDDLDVMVPLNQSNIFVELNVQDCVVTKYANPGISEHNAEPKAMLILTNT